MNLHITRKENRNKLTREIREWVIVCPTCQVDVDGYTEPDEPSYLAGIHNDLHHGHRPDAFVVPVDEPSEPVRVGQIIDQVVDEVIANRVAAHEVAAWRALAAQILGTATARRGEAGGAS